MSARYKVRKAAGSYWLLDMEQDGKHYKEPIELNESGAAIWELADKGWNVQAIAEYLARQYGVEIEMVKEDVLQFFKGLELAGVLIEIK